MKPLYFTLIILVLTSNSCKEKVKPVSERIAKVWTANLVREGSSVVYTKGAVSNVRAGYVNFRLDLSNPASVTLREFDNQYFTGQWEVQNDTKLILKNLTPQPTGNNGTIEYIITAFTDSDLKLSRTTVNQKIGGSLGSYELSN